MATKKSTKKTTKKVAKNGGAKKAPAKKASLFGKGRPLVPVASIAVGSEFSEEDNKHTLKVKKQADITEAVSEETGVPQDLCAKMLRAIGGVDCPNPRIIHDKAHNEETHGEKGDIESAVTQLTEAWEKSVALKKKVAEDNQAIENEAKEKRALAIKTMHAAEEQAEEKIQSVTQGVENNISKSLKSVEGITIKNGEFVFDKDVSDEAITQGFAIITQAVEGAAALSEGFALSEAKYAKALTKSGHDYASFFDPEDPNSVRNLKRIKQGVGALMKMEKYGVVEKLSKARLASIRTLMEAKYNKDDEKDNAARLRGAVDKACKLAEAEDGKFPAQLALRQIVNEFKKTPGKVKLEWLHVILDAEGGVHVVGTPSGNEVLEEAANLSIHLGAKPTFKVDGSDPKEIGEPTAAIADLVSSITKKSIPGYDFSEDAQIPEEEEGEEEEEYEEEEGIEEEEGSEEVEETEGEEVVEEEEGDEEEEWEEEDEEWEEEEETE